MKALFGILLVLFSANLGVCQTLADQLDAVIESEAVGLHSSVLNNAQLQPMPQANYVMINIDYGPINALKQKIELGFGQPLVDRGEAHITVITPPEYDILKEHLSIQQINQFAFIDFRLQEINFQPLCVGQAAKVEGGTTLLAYYVVIESQELLEFRKELHAAYVLNGGHRSKFDPEAFWPHITVGFTDRDIHLSDGVYKGENSCLLKVVLTR